MRVDRTSTTAMRKFAYPVGALEEGMDDHGTLVPVQMSSCVALGDNQAILVEWSRNTYRALVWRTH